MGAKFWEIEASQNPSQIRSSWWFQTVLITWGNDPIWRICFRWVGEKPPTRDVWEQFWSTLFPISTFPGAPLRLWWWHFSTTTSCQSECLAGSICLVPIAGAAIARVHAMAQFRRGGRCQAPCAGEEWSDLCWNLAKWDGSAQHQLTSWPHQLTPWPHDC